MMSPWLFNVYMDGVVREVNARVLGSKYCCRFEINHLCCVILHSTTG